MGNGSYNWSDGCKILVVIESGLKFNIFRLRFDQFCYLKLRLFSFCSAYTVIIRLFNIDVREEHLNPICYIFFFTYLTLAICRFIFYQLSLAVLLSTQENYFLLPKKSLSLYMGYKTLKSFLKSVLVHSYNISEYSLVKLLKR